MTSLILAAVSFGGYIALYKLILFLLLFFGWLWMLNWISQDAKGLSLNDKYWAGIVFAAGAAGAIIFLLTPFFVIALPIYAAAVVVSILAYLKHRDRRVPEFDRVLTTDSIKGLLAGRAVKSGTADSEPSQFIFITANNNEVSEPEPKTPEFFGYKRAYDLFNDAIWRRASNIICSPTEEHYKVVYSVDGASLKQPDISRDQAEYLTRFLKHLAGLDIEEKRKPQRGSFRIFKSGENIYWQVATAGSTAGEQVVITYKTKEVIARIEDLGLADDQLEKLSSLSRKKQGLFIVAGPAKSGVTSTFYTLLRNHDAFLNSICTLEKEPATDLTNIVQNTFSLSDTGTTTYAKKLLNIVRMGADIVGVADCEDPETAKIACNAAKEGKLIYVTLKADSVAKSLGKWIKLVGDRNLIADTLLGITNQRLLRILCEDCKQGYEPNRELIRKFNLSPQKTKVLYRPGKVQYTKRGRSRPCRNCQETGFLGRMSIFEIVIVNDELTSVVRQSKSLSEIDTGFRRAKVLSLQELALKKIVAGQTSVNEMVRVFSSGEKEKKRN